MLTPVNSYVLPTSVDKLLRMSVSEAHCRILKGLPLADVLRSAKRLRLQTDTTAAMLAVQPRTIQRWERAKRRRLDAARGSRFYRLLRVLQVGNELFGSHEAALKWFYSEQRALDCRRPIELMTTDAGAWGVEALLSRIRYNVCS